MPRLSPIRRWPFWTFFVLLIVAVSAQIANAEATDLPQATFDYQSNRAPLVSLDGKWRFHPGDDPDGAQGWASSGFDDSSWPLISSDAPWNDQGYPNMRGFAWYRFSVVVPATHPALAIDLTPILSSWQVFVDGKPAGSFGNMPANIFPRANWQYSMVPLAPAETAASGAPAHRIQVAIRVWQSSIWASNLGGGTEFSGNLLGDSAQITEEQTHHEEHRRLIFADRFAYSIVAFIVGITILGLYFFRPQEREYLWFAVVLLAKGLDATLTVLFQVYAAPPVPIFDLLDGCLVACAQIALLLFLNRVLRLRRKALLIGVLALALISPIPNILYWPGIASAPVGSLLQVLCLLPSALWMLAILAIYSNRRDINARLLVFPIFLIEGLWLANSFLISMNQFGFPIEARIVETPFIEAPFTIHPSILAELLFLFAMLAFIIRRFTIARRREERWEGALEAARQVQHLLLPEAIPQVVGFKIDCIYRPADAVGGDFFQILPQEDGGLLIVVGDVAGKGLPAAMMVSMIVGVIQSEVSHSTDPSELASELNTRLLHRSIAQAGSGFTTCLCAHLSAEGRLTLANAGHLPPYSNGRELDLPGALPLGMLEGLNYPHTSIQLQPGDRLTFLSDGVVEAQSRSGELLGFARAEEISTKPAAEIAEIASAFGQLDDITVVTVEFEGQKALRTAGPQDHAGSC
ncbi:SpoIIE family protein phosphatase [Acidicapsa dinghuensis]|uniref:SpoIIE family protein phosphatase n=1 Tax=Acidicapsa dinghuensis TaxID=2218256 RepID=A0ABW1EC53_9BACT|nr:SpoIIE family protein phosphatase [Acidicapsa dinghuensis]